MPFYFFLSFVAHGGWAREGLNSRGRARARLGQDGLLLTAPTQTTSRSTGLFLFGPRVASFFLSSHMAIAERMTASLSLGNGNSRPYSDAYNKQDASGEVDQNHKYRIISYEMRCALMPNELLALHDTTGLTRRTGSFGGERCAG
ncbi:hypothetical protein FN846DRAFT_608390 [Sphaerosporella brunnea]|uniref:Uncharacterized protein n=1 Tax=Sphaerosporella brunnea TaxID=1250544 RepID=A0A5J5F2H6_9PEZI|nr:hypothetical protein FN846DRAFT_608390 [Sphaerosporella brunnea]